MSITAAMARLAISANAAITYSFEKFESVGIGQLAVTNTTDWDNSADLANQNKVNVISNLTGGPTGQHVAIGGNRGKHMSTEAGLLTLFTEGVASIDVSYSLRFGTDNSGSAVRLEYSADGTFDDKVSTVSYNPTEAGTLTPDAGTWYDFTTTILNTEVTFTDTARLRWDKVAASSSASNTAILDDIKIAAVPEPSTTALLGLGGLALILRRRK